MYHDTELRSVSELQLPLHVQVSTTSQQSTAGARAASTSPQRAVWASG